jgi:acyl carrier protein
VGCARKGEPVARDQVAAELLRLLERAVVDPDDVTPSTPLPALLLDSIDYAEILEALHDRFDIDVEPAELANAKTVGDAQDVIVTKVQAR